MLRIPFAVKMTLGAAAAALLGVGLIGTTAYAATSAGAHQSGAAAGQKGDHRGDRKQIAAAVFNAEADVLGMTPDQLRDALKHGQSVSDLAQARGMTKEQFADRLATEVKPSLDQLVDSKKITQAQEDHVLAAIRAGHIPGWEGRHR